MGLVDLGEKVGRSTCDRRGENQTANPSHGDHASGSFRTVATMAEDDPGRDSKAYQVEPSDHHDVANARDLAGQNQSLDQETGRQEKKTETNQ